ncbi:MULTISPECIES: lasso peptide biosynthesis B2 protein [unclassified Burkholderia]|uniref:lasso peptide biosynthesis B2 protein n=1 Tax=unclassified Burkholderia TaxID=2613784 RepID=UPI0005CE8DFF|nr:MULTISPECIES: lasso peptide biosynthesis B2 protein [unclassified Burkholderia]RQZ41213.1 lasso peptide biosynthesis B2 protein [Burkholderia sp. Bp9090]TGN98599.1 lasso peptide biosynthesis B2 protein [Burkholderia sp. USMB20]
MKNDGAYIFLTHSLVRAMLLGRPVSDAYLGIFKSIFPGAVRGRYAGAVGRIDQPYLQEVCDSIYQADLLEMGGASCYSASIVVQALAFLHGIPSDLVIGVKRQDEKVVGHAWIELCRTGSVPEIVNPGRMDLNEYRALTRMNPETAVTGWVASL